MSATLPRWIRIENALGDLSEVIPDLKAYAELAFHWRDIALAVRDLAADAPVDSPVNLAAYFAKHIGDEEIVEVFGALGLSDLQGKLAQLGDRLLDPDARWAKLLQPANAFVETYGDESDDSGPLANGDDPGLVQLRIPKLAGDGDVGAGPATLAFAISAEGGLECEAGAVWPFRGDAVPPGLLRLGATGSVSAQTGISLPFGKVGKGAANASASADTRIDFFYRVRQPEMPYAEAVVAALTRLPNPLDLSDINHAVQLAGMEGATLVCDGAVSTGLSATLGTGFDFDQLASVSAGLVAQITFKRDAKWLLSLRRDGAALKFVLSRSRTRARDWSVGVDIGLDYSGLARQVHDALSEAVGALGPKLDAIRPFLSPGTYLTKQAESLLDQAVGSIISDSGLKDALLQDLGRVLGQSGTPDLALESYLRSKITDLTASHAGGVLAEAEQWARHVAKGLAEKFPGISADDGLDRLIAQIKPVLDEVKTKFDEAVAEVIKLDGVDRALTDIGIELGNQRDKADRLTKGIRDLVQKFDHFAQAVLEKTGEGVEHKLAARFAWTGGNSRGEQYELIGTFDQVNDQTAALWKALATGQLEPFQRILANPASAPAGLRLDPASSLSRFAGRHRGFALEVAVLGLSVSMRSIIKAQAKIAVSAGGDITVSATGEAGRDVDGFDEGRSASFISTWDLALLKADDPALGGQRKMGVSLKLNHSDKDLETREVDGLLGGLAAAGLVEVSRTRRAQDIYQEWRIASSGKKVQGKIAIDMALTATAVARMVAIGRMCGVDGSPGHRAVFVAAAQALLLSSATSQKRLDRDCSEARRQFRDLAKIDDQWVIIYALRNVDLTATTTLGRRSHDYIAIGRLIELAKTFPRILSQMAQIYDAIPVGSATSGPRWSESDYAKAELALARDARKWLLLNQKLVFWFKSEMHPAMVAFMRLLADMNQVVASSDPLAGLDGKVDVSASSGLITIAMTAGEGEPVSI